MAIYAQIPSSEVEALKDMESRERLRIRIFLTQLKNMDISKARARLILQEEYTPHSALEMLYKKVLNEVYARGS